MSQTFCFGASMKIEDRIANTELVASAGRGRSDSVMNPRLARKYSVDDAEVLRVCPQQSGIYSELRIQPLYGMETRTGPNKRKPVLHGF
jgi:hypothetical protein